MQWSKLRLQFRSRLADQLKYRVDIHAAKYPRDGRVWITFDRKEIASVQAPGFTRIVLGHHMCAYLLKPEDKLFQLGESVFDLINLPIDEALDSPNPLVKGLAFLDQRCGRRRLDALARTAANLPCFAATMLSIRLSAMGKRQCDIVCDNCGEFLYLQSGETRVPGE